METVFKCNLYVTRFVFVGVIRIPVFPVLAEGGAGGLVSAPVGWSTVTYIPAHYPGPGLRAVQVEALTVHVRRPLGDGEVSPAP